MSPPSFTEPPQRSGKGLLCAGSAYLIWGMSPIYWKALAGVPAMETLMHRVVWSALFLCPLLIIGRHWKEVVGALRSKRTVFILVCSTLFVACNWFVFIWAINNDHVLQTSLGYYINPLFSVFLGMVFLREELRPLQVLAVVLAGVAVLYFTLQCGEFPWVALSLAFCFGCYGLIRKVAPVSALVGLSVEMFILSPPAMAYLYYLDVIGVGSIFRVSVGTDLLLMGTALLTALPLLLFTTGARLLNLSTVGFMQYIVPSCFFLFAVFVFHEPISRSQIWTFVLIWLALCIYSADSALFYRRAARFAARSRMTEG